MNGKIIKSGGPELALELENKGYSQRYFIFDVWSRTFDQPLAILDHNLLIDSLIINKDNRLLSQLSSSKKIMLAVGEVKIQNTIQPEKQVSTLEECFSLTNKATTTILISY